jgi:hypothetical protein
LPLKVGNLPVACRLLRLAMIIFAFFLSRTS